MNVTLNVRKVVVLITDATDKIVMHLDMPSSYPITKYESTATIDAAYDCGVSWCQENLGITPEIINCRSPQNVGKPH
jgi:hypothetical protein